MFDQALPHNDVAIRILNATDTLMARDGVQNLSTHKIAKEAGVSVGTIYLYFKDKDDLLNNLILYLFQQFHHCLNRADDPDLPLAERYKALWWATWQFVRENPRVVQNMHQYEALPKFRNELLRCQNSADPAWNKLFRAGQEQGVISLLPHYVLATMTLRVIWELNYTELLRGEQISNADIEEVISRTWKAILV